MDLKQKTSVDASVDFSDAVDNLLDGIKQDYANWTSWEEGIQRFNDELNVKSGRKYTKIMKGTSVWGWTIAVSGFFVAIIGPLFGQLADTKKKLSKF